MLCNKIKGDDSIIGSGKAFMLKCNEKCSTKTEKEIKQSTEASVIVNNKENILSANKSQKYLNIIIALFILIISILVWFLCSN